MTRQAERSVLVTGGSGAIGRFVIEELLARGHRVVALTRVLRGGLPERNGLEWHAADLSDVDALAALLSACNAGHVIHLAAAILNKEGDLTGAISANALASAALFEAARRVGVRRVVYSSSKAVFGPVSGEYGHPMFRPVPEDHPRDPQSVYALTKCLSEDVASFVRARSGLEIVSVRFGTTAGPGKGPQHAGAAILGDIVSNPVRGLPVRLAQGGDQHDDVMYTLEVAQGLVTICLAEGTLPPVLHLDSGELITLRDIAAVVRGAIPGADIAIGDGLDYMGYGGIYCRLDGSRARQQAGYRPRFTLASWVQDFIARVRAEGVAGEVTSH